MDWNEHGGECCGASHVYGFDFRADKDRLRHAIESTINSTEQPHIYENEMCREEGEPLSNPYRGRFGHLIEVVLTDEQMMEWASTLKEYGFRLGPRWLNDNSGNYCNLLTYQTKKPSKPRPFDW